MNTTERWDEDCAAFERGHRAALEFMRLESEIAEELAVAMEALRQQRHGHEDDDAARDEAIAALAQGAIAASDRYLDHVETASIAHAIEAALFAAARRVRQGEVVTLPDLGTLRPGPVVQGRRRVAFEPDGHLETPLPRPPRDEAPRAAGGERGYAVLPAMTIDALIACLETRRAVAGGDRLVCDDIAGDGSWIEPLASVEQIWVRRSDNPETTLQQVSDGETAGDAFPVLVLRDIREVGL